MNNRALLLQDTGHFAEAAPLIERALAISEGTLGPEHPDTAQSLNNLAGVYRDTGRLAAAEPLYERAIAILANVLPADHPNLATVRKNLAILRAQRDGRSNAAPADSIPAPKHAPAVAGQARSTGIASLLRRVFGSR